MRRAFFLCLFAVIITSCASAPPPAPAQPAPVDTSAVEAQLQSLQDRGVAEVLPEDHYRVAKLVEGVRDRGSLARAEAALAELETAFGAAIAREADAAVGAFTDLRREVNAMDRTVSGGTGCTAAAEALAALKAQESEIRDLVFSSEDDVRAALRAQRECELAQGSMTRVLAEAAVCGTVQVDARNAAQMLNAADDMVKRDVYGAAVQLYGAISEGAKGTTEADQALARLDIFGEDLQQRLADQAREAAGACDSERAQANYDLLVGMLAALSDLGDRKLIDTGILHRMPELEDVLDGMRTRCIRPTDEIEQSETVPATVLEVENRINQGDFEQAEIILAEVADPDEKVRLQGLIDAGNNLRLAEEAFADGRIDDTIDLAQRARDGGAGTRAGDLLAEARCRRARTALAAGRAGDATRDVQAALAVAPANNVVRTAAADVYADLGRKAGESGNDGEALRLYKASTQQRDNGELRLEMALLYTGQRRVEQARAQLQRAIKLGAQVDVATRLQVLVVGPMLAGHTDQAWEALHAMAGETSGEANDLVVHALRLPLSTGLGRMVAAMAGPGGRVRRGGGIVVFAGSEATGLDGEMMSGIHRVEGGAATGVSDDLRYMAVREPGGGIVLFDAQAGRAAERVSATPSGAGLESLARSEVVLDLSPFVVRPIEEALASDTTPAEKKAAIENTLDKLVEAGLDYALFANSRGKVSMARGVADAGYEPGLRSAALSGTRIRQVRFGGTPYQEVVVPIRVRGAVQAMLLLGVEARAGDVSGD